MSGKELVRVAIIGTAKRSDYHYGPILQAMPHDVSLVGVWGRSVEPSRRLGEGLNVPWYTDMDRLVSETAPQIGVVCVKGQANGEVGLMAVECGLHILIETPIAYDLGEADAILAAAKRRNLKVEVAEQFHRRPMEQIKLKLIEAGIFGRIYSSFSDFAGHGYHGMSVMRSYLGFDAVPVRVTAFAGRYELAPHLARTRTRAACALRHRSTPWWNSREGGSAYSIGAMPAMILACAGGAAAGSWARKVWGSASAPRQRRRCT